jgi:hypothetical protein
MQWLHVGRGGKLPSLCEPHAAPKNATPTDTKLHAPAIAFVGFRFFNAAEPSRCMPARTWASRSRKPVNQAEGVNDKRVDMYKSFTGIGRFQALDEPSRRVRFGGWMKNNGSSMPMARSHGCHTGSEDSNGGEV